VFRTPDAVPLQIAALAALGSLSPPTQLATVIASKLPRGLRPLVTSGFEFRTTKCSGA